MSSDDLPADIHVAPRHALSMDHLAASNNRAPRQAISMDTLAVGNTNPPRHAISMDTLAANSDIPSRHAISMSTIAVDNDGHPRHAKSMDTMIAQQDLEKQLAGQREPPEEERNEKASLSDWDNDPENPRNWSGTKKWTCTAIVSMYSFVSPLSSSMMAPSLPAIAVHYGIKSSAIEAMTLSIFLLSFAIGPLFFGPLSEMYGRVWVLHLANILLLGSNIGCAFAPNTADLIGFRFLAGWGGSASVGIGGSVISDMYLPQERGTAMALLVIGPLVGPTVGPIAGGFITETIGFKWVFVVIAATCGLASVIALPFLRETYAPVILLRRKRKNMSSEEEEALEQALVDTSARAKLNLLWINLTRPAVLLVRSSICFMLSMYLAFIYGIYYLMFATFPNLFSTVYGFSPGIEGLCYLGLGIGFIIGSFIGAKYGNMLYKYLADKNGGVGKPEMRIPGLIVCSFFVPIGLFWYGWSAQAHTFWIMPIIGTGIFGLGLMMAYLSIQLYLVDAFEFAASALAAASVLRSLFGFGFPLFAGPMYAALGNGPGDSLLAGLSIVIGIPFPIYLYFNGEKIREKSKY